MTSSSEATPPAVPLRRRRRIDGTIARLVRTYRLIHPEPEVAYAAARRAAQRVHPEADEAAAAARQERIEQLRRKRSGAADSARAVDTATLPEETVLGSLEWIAEHLRTEDASEIAATHPVVNADPLGVLKNAWRLSTESWLILDRTGLPIGVFGIAPAPEPFASEIGLPWMMGTPGIEQEGATVARQARAFVESFHDTYPVLQAWSHIANSTSHRWLEWAGFVRTGARAAPRPGGEPMLQFVRVR